MKKLFIAALLICCYLVLHAQTIIQKDPVIEKMVSEVSKDNCFFGVQSVSEDGNEGLPVTPVPA